MTITATQTSGAAMLRMANGSHLDSAATPDAASIETGFTPRYVRVENITDRIAFEWFEGMTSGHALKTVAAGTRTAETSGGVTVSGRVFGFPVLQNKQYRWVVFG